MKKTPQSNRKKKIATAVDPKKMTTAAPERRRLPRIVVALFLVGIVMGSALGWLAEREYRVGHTTLAQEEDLDTHGRTVPGEVTGSRVESGKTPAYDLWYRYRVGETSYMRYSRVGKDDAAHVHAGDPVQVTYLPDHPNISRAAPSIERKMAQAQIFSSIALTVLACVMPFLCAVGGLMPGRRKDRLAGQQQPQQGT
jgi:hypothetical protein